MHLAIKIQVNQLYVILMYIMDMSVFFFKSMLKLFTGGVVLSVVLVDHLAQEWQKSHTMKKDLKEQLVPDFTDYIGGELKDWL